MANKNKFVNPFDKGVNYKDFLESIPNKVSVSDYCKGNLTDEQIEWLLNDLEHYTNKPKVQEVQEVQEVEQTTN